MQTIFSVDTHAQTKWKSGGSGDSSSRNGIVLNTTIIVIIITAKPSELQSFQYKHSLAHTPHQIVNIMRWLTITNKIYIYFHSVSRLLYWFCFSSAPCLRPVFSLSFSLSVRIYRYIHLVVVRVLCVVCPFHDGAKPPPFGVISFLFSRHPLLPLSVFLFHRLFWFRSFSSKFWNLWWSRGLLIIHRHHQYFHLGWFDHFV